MAKERRKKVTTSDLVKGIDSATKAFCGPSVAQIDLTDHCNTNCIGCWVHSPYLEVQEVFPEGKKELSFELVSDLITKLYSSGTKEIILSGSGEPFLYPKISEVINLIKSKRMHLTIITNITALDKTTAALLVDMKVDLLTASIWAGDAEVYSQTHPGKGKAEFKKIEANLKMISAYKRKRQSLFPHIKLYNVVCSKNYHDIEAMIDFASGTDADSVEFQLVDVIKGKTEELALDDGQKNAIVEQFRRIRKRADMVFYDVSKEATIEKFIEEEFSDFGKIWKDYRPGFILGEHAKTLECPQGHQGQIKAISHVNVHETTSIYSFKYRFSFSHKCHSCSLKDKCLVGCDAKNSIEVNLLNLLSAGTFLRRLWSLREEGGFDAKVNSLPCYIGWHYSRILSNGDVIPCCKAARHPLGNLKRASFTEAWHSSQYRQFRLKAKTFPKSDPYFSKIDCNKSCDNWGMNLEIHKRYAKSRSDQTIDFFRLSDDPKLARLMDKDNILIKAKDFARGAFNPGRHDFGKDLVIDGGSDQRWAEYEFLVREAGEYELWSRYASAGGRNVELAVDGEIVKKEGLAKNTGGWTSEYLESHKECSLRLEKGKHILRITSSGLIPHIERIVFFKKGRVPDIAEGARFISIDAASLSEGDLIPSKFKPFKGLLLDGGAAKGFASYEFTVPSKDRFEVWSRYASGESRPIKIFIDGKRLRDKGLGSNSGGWTHRFLSYHLEFDLTLSQGRHTLKIESLGYIPHIKEFILTNRPFNQHRLKRLEEVLGV